MHGDGGHAWLYVSKWGLWVVYKREQLAAADTGTRLLCWITPVMDAAPTSRSAKQKHRRPDRQP